MSTLTDKLPTFDTTKLPTIDLTEAKKLTNMRASGTDANVSLAPKVNFSLEESMEYIQKDEYLEITPANIRMRKIYLDETDRKRYENKVEMVS